jgi:CspA family cold shock protein
MSDGESELHVGIIYDYNAKGPWGRILMKDGDYAWFHEALVAGGGHIDEGEGVEFRTRFDEKTNTLQAVGVHKQRSANEASHSGQDQDIDANQQQPVDADVSSEEPSVTMPLPYTGQVRWFDAVKGQGFIKSDSAGSEDIYVHRSAIADQRYRNLVATEHVEFDLVSTKKGSSAVNVKSLLSGDRKRGVVKSYDHRGGHGVIVDDDTHAEIAVQRSGILGRSLTEKTLGEDELVEYVVSETSRGRQARNVKRLDSRPALYRFADMGSGR